MSRKNRKQFVTNDREAERERRRRRLAAKQRHPQRGVSKSLERKGQYA